MKVLFSSIRDVDTKKIFPQVFGAWEFLITICLITKWQTIEIVTVPENELTI